MEKFYVEFIEENPKYIQLQMHIKKLIDKEEVEDGEKLPTIRALSKFLGVNNVTVVNAYKRLEIEGYAVQKMGSGTYAKRKLLGRCFRKEYNETFKKLSIEELRQSIDFSGESTSSSYFPVQDFKEILNEVLDRDGAEALMYQESLGYKGLRKEINKEFWSNELTLDDILIVSGAQQGIDIVAKSLINVNDNVIIERPTYNGAMMVFNWRRSNIFEIDMEEDGVSIEKLQEILKKNRIKCFYTMSYFQNPTGASYTIEKKKKILALAEKYDFYVLEDDYLSELIFDKNIEYKSFKSLDENNRVIYIKSFSKIFLPGIRIGYVITPRRFREIIQNSKIHTDISTSSLMQRALAMYIETGKWKSHIELLINEYKTRYCFMENYLRERLGDKVDFMSPGGGLNFFIKLKDSVKKDCKELFLRCRDRNVIITPGVMFFKNESEGIRYFRIGYSQTSIDKIKDGIDTIKDILEE